MDTHNNPPVIIVVSGLPRSGTSMMMKMLQAGGMELLTDDIRKADDFNPRGYYEFEAVKSLQKGRNDWLPLAIGKVVKIIAPLLPYLPNGYNYKVIFMTRSMDEILLSQSKMLVARGKTDDFTDDKMMENIFYNQIKKVFDWMEVQPNVQVFSINYNGLINNPSDHYN